MVSPRYSLFWLAGVLGALLALCAPASAQRQPEVTVFAAASLTNALQEAADTYVAAGGGRVRFSFASSSALAKQI
jgi:molybdate transport system substrate-binding protein